MKISHIVLALFIALGVIVAVSTTPGVAEAAAGTDPALAGYIDNETHIAPGTSLQYYRFEYTGDNSPVELRLLNGKNGNVAFNVYTPEQINETTWWLLPPIGRGTVSENDLVWVGRFYAPGPYIVQVQNFSGQPESYTLTIKGESVRLCAVSLQPCPLMKLIPNT